MAEIIFSEAGATLGAQLLPNGIGVLGRTVGGATIGRALGGVLGRAVDQAIFPPPDPGPRLKALHIMESREGAGLALVYGRMRVGGHLIWAGGFKANRQESGGKGGPRVTHYTYSVSLAVAVCEGPDARVDRVWANGDVLDLHTVNHRVYSGSDSQTPDPVIAVIEGNQAAPAYRGTCYIVFEDLDLTAFGQRVPQFSFEVTRDAGVADSARVVAHVRGVNLLPASGEFVYATQPVREVSFPGRERALNVNAHESRADTLMSLDHLADALPAVSQIAVTSAWFGDDLRAETCRIRPGVETRTRTTRPAAWRAGDVDRAAAHLVSQTEAGTAYYGGTPADWTLIQLLQELKQRGYAPTLTPFLLMDIPPGNSLPNFNGGNGQPAFPWRGRIWSTRDGAPDATDAVTAFLGTANAGDFELDDGTVRYRGDAEDWGYRRFVLHHAWMARAAGGVSSFLIGSEMRDLVRLRDAAGGFPFVDGLCQLADEVAELLGPNCAVSYAADWTEYGAYRPDDGRNDVFFPLDQLWAHDSIAHIAVDWYPPAGDWRDGRDHLDAEAGYSGPTDPDYVRANQQGGEAFDWFYANAADRAAQIRTPIEDELAGEDWIFRAKDICGWWRARHTPRLGGVPVETPTNWVPESKPIRLAEIGFPAVDKGLNAPNLFYDPKSSESQLPPFSNGARDDVGQGVALSNALAFWQSQPEIDSVLAWAWDARPFPAFPSRGDIWGDGENWAFGHWLNGRTGLASVQSVMIDLGARAGVDLHVDAGLGLVEGYALEGPTRLRDALAPLLAALDLRIYDQMGALHLAGPPQGPVQAVAARDCVAPGVTQSRHGCTQPVEQVALHFVDLSRDYQPGVVRAGEPNAEAGRLKSVHLPIALSPAAAERLADAFLVRMQARARLDWAEPTAAIGLALGDRITLAGRPEIWQVRANEIGVETTSISLSPDTAWLAPKRAGEVPSGSPPARLAALPDLLVIDCPPLRDETRTAPRQRFAVYADPWTGPVAVRAGPDTTVPIVELVADRPALTGVLVAPLAPGPVYRWDKANCVEVEMAAPELSSQSIEAVLSGANQMLVETDAGWELLGFADAELRGENTFQLSRLLRGLRGTESSAEHGANAGARCVFVDDRLHTAVLDSASFGERLTWTAGQADPLERVHENRIAWPWRPGHLRRSRQGDRIEWSGRGPEISDSWAVEGDLASPLFDVMWEDHLGVSDPITVQAGSAIIPAAAIAAHVRARVVSGWTSDWVSIQL